MRRRSRVAAFCVATAVLRAFLRSRTDEDLLRDPRWSDPWPQSGAGPRPAADALVRPQN